MTDQPMSSFSLYDEMKLRGVDLSWYDKRKRPKASAASRWKISGARLLLVRGADGKQRWIRAVDLRPAIGER